MKYLLFGFLVAVSLDAFYVGQETNGENSREHPFPEGGFVKMRLSSGHYTVRAATGDRILVRWEAKDTEFQKEMKKIKVRTEISGNVATVLTEGPTKHARITIEIPTRSDIHLRMRAGEAHISGIEGNKDIRMTAGELKIDLAPRSYSRVHASVTVGDLRANPLGISKDGIRNSFDWTGTGRYTLQASLFAGDLTLARAREQNAGSTQ